MGSSEHWKSATVAELQAAGVLLVEDGNHGEYRPRHDEFTSDGMAFIRAADLDDGRILFDLASRINEVALARIRKGIGAPGDVLLSHKGTVGKIAFAPLDCEPFVCSPQTTFWRALDQSVLDRRYLYYYLKSAAFHQQLDSRKAETDMAEYVSLTSQRTLRVVLPSIEDQHVVADTLGGLDDKIALNRRMNETLQATARAIFKSWFVDFDLVRAKMAGRQPPGMDAATADLFPSSFQESPLGKILAGWAVATVGREFDVRMGQSPPGSTYNETGEGLPFFQGRADFGFRYPTHRVYCTAPTRLAAAGDTLVSVRAPVGDMNMADVDCSIGRGVAAVRHKSGSRSYTYYMLRSLEEAFASFDAEGTVFGSITKKGLHSIACLVPPDELVVRFEEAAKPTDELVLINERQSRQLTWLRDLLLPMLMSGDARVRKLAENHAE